MSNRLIPWIGGYSASNGQKEKLRLQRQFQEWATAESVTECHVCLLTRPNYTNQYH
jgi:hypothetical protein